MASTYTNPADGDGGARQVITSSGKRPAINSQTKHYTQALPRPPWIKLGDAIAVLLANLAKGGAP